MSCYSCGTSFGAFKREHGCKNCGFAFCTKCLPHKVDIPKLNNEKHRVCLKCYNIMTGKVKPKEDPARYSPPENYKKRVQALQEREAAGKTGVGTSGKPAPGPGGGAGGGWGKVPYKGLSQADMEIQQRLEKLKEKTPQEIAAAKVTASEIDDRLAKLKGMDPERYQKSSKPTFQPPDRRTQQEQMNDLLTEIGNEVELDSRLPDPTQQISDRLAKLRETKDASSKEPEGQNQDPNENNLNKPSLRDSQTFVQNILDTPNGSTVKAAPDKNTAKTPEGGGDSDSAVSPEEMKRILTEAAEELEQDAQKALKGLQQDKEIMKRLQDIKQRRKQSTTDVNRDDKLDDSNSENEDSDDEALEEDLIKQAVEEAKLDEAAAKDGIDTSSQPDQPSKVSVSKPDQPSKVSGKKSNKAVIANDDNEWYDPDELPYCCICTEDATVRCLGCDHDLYCSKCFSDGHKELGLTDHKSIQYTPPKGAT